MCRFPRGIFSGALSHGKADECRASAARRISQNQTSGSFEHATNASGWLRRGRAAATPGQARRWHCAAHPNQHSWSIMGDNKVLNTASKPVRGPGTFPGGRRRPGSGNVGGSSLDKGRRQGPAVTSYVSRVWRSTTEKYRRGSYAAKPSICTAAIHCGLLVQTSPPGEVLPPVLRAVRRGCPNLAAELPPT
jgi:hypothetical protein